MAIELKDIVEESYQVFKKYKAAVPLDVCTECCITKKQENELVNLSVRHIPFDLLYKYNTAAKAEKPDIQEFKHFLPRFLEFTADLKFLHHSGELILSRFDYYDKNEWTDEEQELMQNFGQAYFRQCLTVYPLPELEGIDSILIALWKTKIDIESILTDWTTITTKESLFHFNELISRSFENNEPNKLSSPFAERELSRLIVEWVEQDITKDRFAAMIEKTIMESPPNLEERILNELSQTYEKLKM